MKSRTISCALLLSGLIAAVPARAEAADAPSLARGPRLGPIGDDVSVAVAANFTEAVRRIAPLFEKATGHRVQASFGATGTFYAQIRNGAPFEVLLSADDSTPAKLAAEGYALPASRFTYALGRLVLWSATPGYVDARGDILEKNTFARLAIANPKLAPYGSAAVDVMKKLGVYDAVAPKLVQGDNIAQTFQFVSTGNAPLGFVALAQVLALPEKARGSYWVVPARLHAPIRQDAILLKPGADKPAAKAFLEFLKSAPARGVIESLGYGTKP